MSLLLLVWYWLVDKFTTDILIEQLPDGTYAYSVDGELGGIAESEPDAVAAAMNDLV